MQIDVEHPAFKTRQLAVETAGFFRAPRLLVNGSVVKANKGRYSIPSDAGVATPVELKYNFFDPVPKMKIGGEPIVLARSFQWYEYIWFVILVLLFIKVDPIGGLVGVLAAVASARIFRSHHSALAKIGLLALIVLSAFVAVVVVEVLLRIIVAQL